MSETYTVRDVREGKVKPNPHGGGNLQAFYVDFVRPDGKLEMGVYWQRKEGNVPQPEESVFGDITEGDYGPRFKQAKGGPSPAPREASTGGNVSSTTGAKQETDWDAIGAEKRRCHSQEMALRFMAIGGNVPGLVGVDLITHLADWFDADAIAAGQKASQGAGAGTGEGGSPRHSSVQPTSAPPPEEAPKDDHWFLENLLVQGGASSHAAGTLARFALEELSPENLKKCEGLLSNLDSQVDGRERLEKSYVKAHGPLPAEDDDGLDLPF